MHYSPSASFKSCMGPRRCLFFVQQRSGAPLDLPGQGPPLCLQPVSLVKKQLGCDPELALELPQQLVRARCEISVIQLLCEGTSYWLYWQNHVPILDLLLSFADAAVLLIQYFLCFSITFTGRPCLELQILDQWLQSPASPAHTHHWWPITYIERWYIIYNVISSVIVPNSPY